VRASVDGVCRPDTHVVTRRCSVSRITSEWFEHCAPHLPAPVRIPEPTPGGESATGDKSPKKQNVKKPSKSLKEKRADKQSKREDKRPGFGH
jgi:hypothetical protein